MDARWSTPPRISLRAALAALAAASLALGGCRRKAAADGAAASVEPDAAGAEVVAIAAPDGAADATAASPTLHALTFVTPVMSEPEWAPRDPSKASEERKGVIRLGYLRKGDAVAVRPQLVKKPSCAEGWYELLPASGAPPGATGGFVCGKNATLDASDGDLAAAPHAPNMAGPLPYDYGLNLVNGTPLYTRLPVRREREAYERGLAVGRASRRRDKDAADGAGSPAPQASAGDDGSGEAAWYLAHKDRSQVSMQDLKGDAWFIDKRMVKGFYLALDGEVKTRTGSFWRTTDGKFVPKEYVLVHEPKVEFEGVWVGAPGEKRHVPLGWVTNPHVWKYSLQDDGRMHRHEHADRFAIVQLTGKKQLVEQLAYWETDEGWWLREMDGSVTNPGPPPGGLAAGEKWIDVNLGRQSLVAFEGDRPVFATIVSTGRHDDDPAQDHRTRPGEFRVFEKHVSATMDADTATDGPYSIQDVPWIMYFDGSTALHGAFWHSRFGHERSHGCVNMTPHDAHELFGWIGPRLPDGWHGVRAIEANQGTRVLVHDDGKTAEESREEWKKRRKGEDARDAGGKDEPPGQ